MKTSTRKKYKYMHAAAVTKSHLILFLSIFVQINAVICVGVFIAIIIGMFVYLRFFYLHCCEMCKKETQCENDNQQLWWIYLFKQLIRFYTLNANRYRNAIYVNVELIWCFFVDTFDKRFSFDHFFCCFCFGCCCCWWWIKRILAML